MLRVIAYYRYDMIIMYIISYNERKLLLFAHINFKKNINIILFYILRSHESLHHLLVLNILLLPSL